MSKLIILIVVLILLFPADALRWGFASSGDGGPPCYPGNGYWRHIGEPESDGIYCYYGYEMKDWPYPFFVIWGHKFIPRDEQTIDLMMGIVDFLNGWD